MATPFFLVYCVLVINTQMLICVFILFFFKEVVLRWAMVFYPIGYIRLMLRSVGLCLGADTCSPDKS